MKKLQRTMMLVFMMLLCIAFLFGCGKKKSDTTSEEKVQNVTGTITKVEQDGFTLRTDKKKEISFVVDSDTVDATDKDGMAEKDYVNVVYIIKDGKNLATDVSYETCNVEGEVVNCAQRAFDLKVKDSKKVLAFIADANSTYNTTGACVLEGDKVAVSYQKSAEGNYVLTVDPVNDSETSEQSDGE